METCPVQKTYKQQWFSWPWKPWETTVSMLLGNQVVVDHQENVIYCSPEAADKLKNQKEATYDIAFERL